MNQDAAQRFGTYIKRLREERQLSIRGLAKKAGIDDGGLTRLERGKICAPQPATLKALAMGLQVPLADMFARAGYVTPYDLPSICPYLRARYGYLPEESLAAADAYFQRLIHEHGLDPSGPTALADEVT